jgi:Phage integrase family
MLHGKGDEATTRGFHPTATDALARWIDTRRQLESAAAPLFCILAGGPVHPQYVRNLLHRLGAKAGVDKRVHPYGLLHTFAWGRAGAPVTTISALLGHSSIAETARYLAHLTNHQAVSALAAVDLPEVGCETAHSPGTRRPAAAGHRWGLLPGCAGWVVIWLGGRPGGSGRSLLVSLVSGRNGFGPIRAAGMGRWAVAARDRTGGRIDSGS